MAGLLDGLLNGNGSGDGSGLLSFLNSLGMGPAAPAAPPAQDTAAPASFADRFNASAPAASFVDRFGAAAPAASVADRFGAAPTAPAFGAGASPMLFANAPGSTPGNPALPLSAPPVIAQGDDGEDDTPVAASPIAVGKNYQMPRVGDASAFTPDPAASPANSQPTQGQGLPAAAPSSAAPNPLAALSSIGSGIGNRLLNSTQSFANSGNAISALGNGIASLITGNREDPTGRAESQQAQIANVTARALLAKGVDPSVVAAAVQPGNGELLKSLFTQMTTQGTFKTFKDADGNLFTSGPSGKPELVLASKDDKFQHYTTKNFDGSETPHTFNTKTGEDLAPGNGAGAPGTPAGGLQPLLDKIATARAGGASRDDLIKQVPTQYQGYISALLDGKATPANIGRGPERGALMMLAHAVDGTFDETTIPARIQTAIDFTPKGKSGASIVAFNTVQHHIGKLSDDLETLGDTGWTALNAVRNGIATNTPLDKEQGKAVQRVNDDIKAVTDEMSGAYKAGHISDTEIKSWNSLVSSNKPLPQMRQAISDFVDLLNGKRDALNKVHQQIMGGDAAIIDKEENSMITQKAHDRNEGVTATSTIQNGATATNPKTGQKITFKDGKWQ